MPDLPAGVVAWSADTADDWNNVIVAISGGPKTGKTFMSTHVQRPLYYVFLDAHDNLDAALRHADEAGFTGPVYLKRIPTTPYKLLTEERAQTILKEVEDFATWAKGQALLAQSKGEPTGTFVLDGGVKFKGYAEKALLGESATLGFRPSRGVSTNISTYDYAEPNAYVMDFLASFRGTPLDVLVTWEGRRIWKRIDGKDQRTDGFRSSMPDTSFFVINAEVKTLMSLENIIVNNEVVGQTAIPKVQIGYNGYDAALNGRVMRSQTVDDLKVLFGLEQRETKPILDPVEMEQREANPNPFDNTVEE